MLCFMKTTSFNYTEIRNVGTALNLYICGNLFGNLWEKLENHGEINMWGLKGYAMCIAMHFSFWPPRTCPWWFESKKKENSLIL